MDIDMDFACDVLEKPEHIFHGDGASSVREAVRIALSRVPKEDQADLENVRFVYVAGGAVTKLLSSRVETQLYQVVVPEGLAQLEKMRLAAVVAHELGHAHYWAQHGKVTPDGVQGELIADAFAVRCNLRAPLCQQLQEDLASGRFPKFAGQFRSRIAAL